MVCSIRGQDGVLPAEVPIQIDGTHLHLQTDADGTYFLEHSTDLQQWDFAGGYIIGDGLAHAETPPATNRRQFYRYNVQWSHHDDPHDTDRDGLQNHFELVSGLNPTHEDSDGDSLKDGWEVTHDLDATSSDQNNNGIPDNQEDFDQDGASNQQEQENNADPHDPIDQGLSPLVIFGDGDQSVEISGSRTYTIPTDGQNYLVLVHIHSEEYPEFTQDESEYDDIVRLQLDVTGQDRLTQSIRVNTLHEQWVAAEDKGYAYNEYEPIATEVLSIVKSSPESPVNVTVEIGITNVTDENYPTSAIVELVPLENAPDVLAVNSDFDEGRIDSTTGYALPDCDDITGVDPQTGVGNTLLSLEAERDHLDDSTIQDNYLVDNDLHLGWFGVHPNHSVMWDGATVTINKVDQLDTETGYKESGQVRFYAKWGESGSDHYGIEPYTINLPTEEDGEISYSPKNLTLAGINGKEGESVCGSKSKIPAHAKFYMEGVRPGKITLEWRYQKGNVDIKHQQTFLVATQQSADAWRRGLAYKIKLETSNDPSKIIDITIPPKFEMTYTDRMERISEYYDSYQENYLVDNDFMWSGLGRLAANQIVAGLSDMEYAQSSSKLASVILPSSTSGAVPLRHAIKTLQQTLFEGAFDIYSSIGWQHLAYRSSGIEALEWILINAPINDSSKLIEAWRDLHSAKNGGAASLISDSSFKITDFEQNEVVVPTWTQMASYSFGTGVVEWLFSQLSINPVEGGDSFNQAVPGGDVTNAADRWVWITNRKEAPPIGPGDEWNEEFSSNGILASWENASASVRENFVSKTTKDDAKRFAIFKILPVQVNDHLDVK